MRRLIVMRHAKSAWDTGASSDHSRPLNSRGRRDAPRVGDRLVELGWVPDLVLSSDSARTRETWAGLQEALGDVPTRFTRALYHAGPAAVEAQVGQVSASVETVLVLGHNPGWEDVVAWLCGIDARMTTANAALLELDDAPDWPSALRQAPGWTLHDVVRPKEL